MTSVCVCIYTMGESEPVKKLSTTTITWAGKVRWWYGWGGRLVTLVIGYY